MKYFHIDAELNEEMLNKFFEFANVNEYSDWTIAIWSNGGRSAVASTIIDIINSRPDKVVLIAHEVYSAAFDLFYHSNCNKKIASSCKGLMHLVKAEMYIMGNGKPAYFEDEAILRGWKEKDADEDKCFAKSIMTKKEYKKFKKGDDVYFTFTRMKEIFPDAEII